MARSPPLEFKNEKQIEMPCLVGSTNCSQSNGGCSHLCLPNPQGYQCFCPEGVQLNPADPFICQGGMVLCCKWARS